MIHCLACRGKVYPDGRASPPVLDALTGLGFRQPSPWLGRLDKSVIIESM